MVTDKISPSTLSAPRLFVRDKMQWTGYLLIGIYCYIISAFGPVMPLLRSELGLDYKQTAMHLSAYALGVLVAGATGERTMRALGLSRGLWGCGLVLTLAVILVLLGHHVLLTICGAWLIGCSGSTMGQTISTIMSERFKEERTIALTEANIAASAFSSVAPIFVGLVLSWHMNWRVAYFPIIVLFLVLFALFKNVAEPFADHAKKNSVGGRLPLSYWAYWLVILLSVAGEWSIVFWATDYMRNVAHFSAADASCSMSVFLIAMIVGRVSGARLARTIPANILLPLAGMTGLIGFLIFWLGRMPALNLVGLFLAGFGNSNVYPMSFAQALAAAPNQSSLASARISVASGTANLVAPLIMGAIADKAGIWTAYSLVAVLWTMVVLVVLAGERIGRARTAV